MREQGAYSQFWLTNGINILICQTKDTSIFKDLTIYLDGVAYTIPADQMYTKMAFNLYYVNLMSIRNWDMYIIGLNFFQNYYTVFD